MGGMEKALEAGDGGGGGATSPISPLRTDTGREMPSRGASVEDTQAEVAKEGDTPSLSTGFGGERMPPTTAAAPTVEKVSGTAATRHVPLALDASSLTSLADAAPPSLTEPASCLSSLSSIPSSLFLHPTLRVQDSSVPPHHDIREFLRSHPHVGSTTNYLLSSKPAKHSGAAGVRELETEMEASDRIHRADAQRMPFQPVWKRLYALGEKEAAAVEQRVPPKSMKPPPPPQELSGLSLYPDRKRKKERAIQRSAEAEKRKIRKSHHTSSTPSSSVVSSVSLSTDGSTEKNAAAGKVEKGKTMLKKVV